MYPNCPFIKFHKLSVVSCGINVVYRTNERVMIFGWVIVLYLLQLFIFYIIKAFFFMLHFFFPRVTLGNRKYISQGYG